MAKLAYLIKKFPDNFWIFNKEGTLDRAPRHYKPRNGEFIIELPYCRTYRVTNKKFVLIEWKDLPEIVRVQFELFHL